MFTDKVYGEKVFMKVIGKGNERDYKIVVTAKLYSCGGKQNPHFSVTGEVLNKRGGTNCCGCIHDEVAKHFPGLAKYIPFHLFSTDGPMHYIENAIYHAGYGKHYSKYETEEVVRMGALKSTISFGLLAGEDDNFEVEGFGKGLEALCFHDDDLDECTEKRLRTFLEARKPALMAKFNEAMTELFGKEAVDAANAHSAE